MAPQKLRSACPTTRSKSAARTRRPNNSYASVRGDRPHFERSPITSTITCRFLALVFVIGGFPYTGVAQTVSGTQSAGGTNKGIVRFFENTDVFLSNRDDLVFEAHLFPHLPVFENITSVFEVATLADCPGSADTQATSTDGPKLFYSISATPAVRLRMLSDISRPVRTPSYMPRTNFQLILAPKFVERLECVQKIIAEAKARGVSLMSGADEVTSTFLMREFHAVVGHHSNGQDGCLYTNERRDGEACVENDGEVREINKRDGSFSTNYLRVGSNFRWTRVDVTGTPRMDRTLRAELQWHPKAITSDKIEDQYGRLRLIAGGTFAQPMPQIWCKRSASISANLEVITLDRPSGVDPVAFTVAGTCHPTENGGWGLFARFYSGQDYYNLGFLDNIRSLQVGATYSTDGFFNFRR